MKIRLPAGVEYIINRLYENGFEAYIVGGCVRDSLLGKEPDDWDVCTSALPEQIIGVFNDLRVIETGLKHGTVTVLKDDEPVEVTTYRTDGTYSDNRRPDSVKFIIDLTGDLARRDFTVNAMAYNPSKGIIDHFGGKEDLESGIIKCVGNAGERFREDALRIMRAMRFAAQLGFKIDSATAEAMQKNRHLLKKISAERIAVELNKLLIGENVNEILNSHVSVLTEIIPELTPAIGFEQNNPYHCYDVFLHTLYCIDNTPKDTVLRLTMLFHDIEKPACYTEDEKGIGHFHGHPQKSAETARLILRRLKYDNETVDTVKTLILYHDADIIPESRHIKRWLNRLGEERLRQLLLVKHADSMAHVDIYGEKTRVVLKNVSEKLDEIIRQQQCFSLKDLAVDGRDMINLGIKEGTEIGAVLNALVDLVIDEKIENKKADLLYKANLLRTELPEIKH